MNKGFSTSKKWGLRYGPSEAVFEICLSGVQLISSVRRLLPLLPQKPTFGCSTISVAKGQKPTFSNPFISCLWQAERGRGRIDRTRRSAIAGANNATNSAPARTCVRLGRGCRGRDCSRFMRDFYMVQRTAAAAWFQPSPELIMTTRSPRLILPSSIASSNAIGMQAEPV
jgi:hypothetical protein